MATQIQKNETDPTKNPPDSFFPCLKCGSEKKSGSLTFWRLPGFDVFFCATCVPPPGSHCEFFELTLDENFQWIARQKFFDREKIDHEKNERHERGGSEQAASATPPSSRRDSAEEEFMRCIVCRQLVSQFDLFEHPCRPKFWLA